MPCHAMYPIPDLFLECFSYVLQIDMHFICTPMWTKKISCKKWVLQNQLRVPYYLYYRRGEEMTIHELRSGSHVLHAKNDEQFTTTGNRHRPDYQWGQGPLVSHADQSYVHRFLEKVNARTHHSATQQDQHKMHGPQPLPDHFTFPQEINDAIFPNTENAKQLRKIYLCFYHNTPLCLCINFIMIKCHNMARHA
jgi:hypothetical protein